MAWVDSFNFQAKIYRFKQLLRVTGGLSLGLEVMVLTVCVAVLGLVLPCHDSVM